MVRMNTGANSGGGLSEEWTADANKTSQRIRIAREPTQARTQAHRRIMRKTGATLTAHHVGSREVAFTDMKHNISSVCANFKEAFKHFHEITTGEECYFTESDTQTDPTPPFPLHFAQPESNG